MNKTIEYLDRLQATYDGASDYRLAKLLAVTPQTVSKYRHEKNFMSVNIAYRLALLINEDPAKVIAETQLDHIKEPESVTMYQWMLAASKSPEVPVMPRFQAA